MSDLKTATDEPITETDTGTNEENNENSGRNSPLSILANQPADNNSGNGCHGNSPILQGETQNENIPVTEGQSKTEATSELEGAANEQIDRNSTEDDLKFSDTSGAETTNKTVQTGEQNSLENLNLSGDDSPNRVANFPKHGNGNHDDDERTPIVRSRNEVANGILQGGHGWSSYGSSASNSYRQEESGLDNQNTVDKNRENGKHGNSNTQNENSGSFSFRRSSTRHKFTLVTIAFVNFCASASYSLLAPFFPHEAEAKGASQSVIGMIFGAYELVIFLTAPIFGNFLTRMGAKFMFTSGVFVSGVCAVLFGFLDKCPSGVIYVAMCFLTRSIEALGSSAFLVASFAIVAHEFPNNVATVFGALETFSGLGMMVGPPIGGALYQVGGFGLPFFTLGGVTMACGLISIWLLPVQNYIDVPFKGSVISLFLKPSAFVVTLSVVIGALALGFLDPTLANHLAEFNLSPLWVGMVFLLGPAVYAITAPIWGWIGDNKGYTIAMMIVGNLFSAVSFLLMGPAPFIPIPFELWLVIISLMLMGLFLGCALIPSFKALIDSASANGYPNSFETYGIVSGLFNSAFSFGSFLGPTAVGGFVNHSLGFPWSSTICAGCFLVATLSLLLLSILQRRAASKSAYADLGANEEGTEDEIRSILNTGSHQYHSTSTSHVHV